MNSFGLPIPSPLEQELARAKSQLERYQRAFALAAEAPKSIFTVIAVTGENRCIVAGSPPVEITVPDGAKVGDQLRCYTAEQNGYEVLPAPVIFGAVVTVTQVLGQQATVTDGSTSILVHVAERGRRPLDRPRFRLCAIRAGYAFRLGARQPEQVSAAGVHGRPSGRLL